MVDTWVRFRVKAHRLRKDLPAFRRKAWSIGRLLGVRLYAVAVLLAALGLSALALRSVIRTVFIPSPVPDRLLQWQAHIDAAALRQDDVPGVTGPAARSPLGHYHRVERWFEQDKQNGCTVAGCHEPLPHAQKMKVPAFANMHTSFLTCQMCHEKTDGAGNVLWMQTQTLVAVRPPAVLRLLELLEMKRQAIQQDPKSIHETVKSLLAEVLTTAGSDAALQAIHHRLDTSQPGSPVWNTAMDRLVRELPAHARGEYGAKLVRGKSAGDWADASEKLRLQAKDYLALTDEAQMRKNREIIHANVVKEATTCVACHSGNSAVKFEELGYPASRARALRQLQLARLMQQIRQGQQFFLPSLVGNGDAK